MKLSKYIDKVIASQPDEPTYTEPAPIFCRECGQDITQMDYSYYYQSDNENRCADFDCLKAEALESIDEIEHNESPIDTVDELLEIYDKINL